MKDLIEKYLNESSIDEELDELLENMTEEEFKDVVDELEDELELENMMESIFKEEDKEDEETDDEEDYEETDEEDEDEDEDEEITEAYNQTEMVIDHILEETEETIEEINDLMLEGVEFNYDLINEDIIVFDENELDKIKILATESVISGNSRILEGYLDSLPTLNEAPRAYRIAKLHYRKLKSRNLKPAAKYVKSIPGKVKNYAGKAKKYVGKQYVASKEYIKNSVEKLKNWRKQKLQNTIAAGEKEIAVLKTKLKQATNERRKAAIRKNIDRVADKVNKRKEYIQNLYDQKLATASPEFIRNFYAFKPVGD